MCAPLLGRRAPLVAQRVRSVQEQRDPQADDMVVQWVLRLEQLIDCVGCCTAQLADPVEGEAKVRWQQLGPWVTNGNRVRR